MYFPKRTFRTILYALKHKSLESCRKVARIHQIFAALAALESHIAGVLFCNLEDNPVNPMHHHSRFSGHVVLCVFKSLLNCTSEISLSRNATGREFQRHGPPTEKLQSPALFAHYPTVSTSTAKRCEFCCTNQLSVSHLLHDAHDKLFKCVLYYQRHTLPELLPDFFLVDSAFHPPWDG